MYGSLLGSFANCFHSLNYYQTRLTQNLGGGEGLAPPPALAISVIGREVNVQRTPILHLNTLSVICSVSVLSDL